MQQVTVAEAKKHLIDLIDAAVAGEEILIINQGGLSVQLVPRVTKTRKRQFGSAKGLISMASDFDEPLDEFNEYTE
jgi:antitoxin (DNA-binding transcriptional repressor) of toxin-antitoxin stability system